MLDIDHVGSDGLIYGISYPLTVYYDSPRYKIEKNKSWNAVLL